jgi:hypothetical protein
MTTNGNQQQQRPATKTTTTPPRNVDGGIKVKGNRKVWHHLFKSDVQKMMKNVSFKKDQPQIQELEHTHVFHTINSQFKPQTTTQIVAGHFHEVQWAQLADGTPVVKSVSGPKRYAYITRGGRQRRVIQDVKWTDAASDDRDAMLVDKHTHQFQYIHSEELSEANIRSLQQGNAHAIATAKSVGLEEQATGGSEA